MTIYKGNNKIDRIFIGSTEISKVYKGSTLVFENSRKIPTYGYQDRYLLGSNSTSGVVVGTVLSTLVSVSGTLGASGSTITVSGDNTGKGAGPYSYYQTLTFNGVKLHMYTIVNPDVRAFWAHYVIEDAKTGSKCCQFTGLTNSDNRTQPICHPATVTVNSMTYVSGSNTYSRAAANDTNYTRNGFKA